MEEKDKRPWHCEECGSPLIQSQSGSVCPSGCGRLHPPMPEAQARINAAKLIGVPEVSIAIRPSFEIPGKDGKWIAGRKCTRGSLSLDKDRDNLVILNGELRFLKPEPNKAEQAAG